MNGALVEGEGMNKQGECLFFFSLWGSLREQSVKYYYKLVQGPWISGS